MHKLKVEPPILRKTLMIREVPISKRPQFRCLPKNEHDQIKLIKTRGERGMKCIVSDTLRNDLRLETKLSSACRDIHKVLIINFLRTSGEFLMHSFFIKMYKN